MGLRSRLVRALAEALRGRKRQPLFIIFFTLSKQKARKRPKPSGQTNIRKIRVDPERVSPSCAHVGTAKPLRIRKPDDAPSRGATSINAIEYEIGQKSWRILHGLPGLWNVIYSIMCLLFQMVPQFYIRSLSDARSKAGTK